MTPSDATRAILRWYSDAGVDESVAAKPSDFFADAAEPRPSGFPTFSETTDRPAEITRRGTFKTPDQPPVTAIEGTTAPSADEAVASAIGLASQCESIDALCEAITAFDGCSLKKSARNTVILDGTIGADLLVMGEAPGRDEDRVGKPFVGRAGQLLDKMLAAIGRNRAENVLISNVIYWRPPGNRTPTATEVAICKPFVERLIQLTSPRAIVIAGNAPLQALLGKTGITRARGKWVKVTTPDGTAIPALPMFHPAFLLRRPEQKRLAWHDLQSLSARLTDS